MAARDLRGYGSTYTPPKYAKSPEYTGSYQPSPYYPTGTEYPICTLSPPPFEVTNYDKSSGYGDFTICFDLSAKGYKGYDLAALQLVVSDKCYDAVKTVSFGGKKYEPVLTQYTNEKNIGVKIGGKSLVTFASLYNPVKVCITLKGVCANADSLYNIITYFPVYSDNCATTSLYNPTPSPNYYPSPVKSYYPSPVYTYSPKYEVPSPSYSYSPKYESPSPSYSYSPVYKTPSPSYSPVYKTPSPSYSPVYETPSPSYSPVYKTPSPSYSPVYETPSPSYSPVYETPSPSYSPVYETPSPSYSPVYESPSYSPVYESPSPSPVYETPSPVYNTPSYGGVYNSGSGYNKH
jgi:hypothetical protein